MDEHGHFSGGRRAGGGLALLVGVGLAAGAVGGAIGALLMGAYLTAGEPRLPELAAPPSARSLTADSTAQPAPAPAPTPQPPPTPAGLRQADVGVAPDSGDEPLVRVFREVEPSVVGVTNTRFRRSSGGTPQGQGSGFIIDDQGHVLTNNHVVQGARSLQIRLWDGSVLPAEVMGTDPGSDLALLKAQIPDGKLHPAQLADSDRVQPGQSVIAVGAPFGLQNTITAGIVSAVERDWGSAAGRPMRGLIQTDAPINPGNSGGPLLNPRGEVIGITTAIESPVRGSVGVGFAIPINTALRIVPRLKGGEQIQHPWIGISGVVITPDLAHEYRLPVQAGVWIAEVLAGSPAEKAGLRGAPPRADSEPPLGGDIITTANGAPINNLADLSQRLEGLRVGESVELAVIRDGRRLTIKVELGAWPLGLS